MNKASVLGIALALTLSATGSVLAQGNNQRPVGPQNNGDCRNGPGNCAGPDQRQRPNQNDRQPNQQPGPDRFNQNAGRPNQTPGPDRNNQARNDGPRGFHEAGRGERGAGPNQSFHRGGRLPPQYRSHQYVVDDWRGHHLSAPPRGYHWVQNGNDYLLVAITTGVIMQLLLGN